MIKTDCVFKINELFLEENLSDAQKIEKLEEYSKYIQTLPNHSSDSFHLALPFLKNFSNIQGQLKLKKAAMQCFQSLFSLFFSDQLQYITSEKVALVNYLIKFGVKFNPQTILLNIDEQVDALAQCIAVDPQFGIEKLKKFFNPGEVFAINKIAILCAKRTPQLASFIIAYAKIQCQKTILEIVKIHIESAQVWEDDPKEFAEDVGLDYEANAGELIRLLAQHNPHNQFVIAYLSEVSEEERVNLARFCAEKADFIIQNQWENFNITKKDYVIEIFKICVSHIDAIQLKHAIKQFNITDEELLFEIVAKFAALAPEVILTDIEEFYIKDTKKLIAIAEICVKNGAIITFHNIQYFPELEEAAVHKMVAQVSAKDSALLLENLSEFNRHHKAFALELAELYAQNGWIRNQEQLLKFSIDDPSILNELFVSIILQEGNNFLINFPNFINIQKYPSIFSFLKTGTFLNYSKVLQEFAFFIEDIAFGCQFEWAIQYLQSIKDPYIQKTACMSMLKTISLLAVRLTAQQLSYINQHDIIKSVYSLRLPDLCVSLADEISLSFSNVETFEKAKKKFGLMNKMGKPATILATALLAEREEANDFLKFLYSNLKTWKDGDKARLLIKVLYFLRKTSLSDDVQTAVLNKIASSANPLNALNILFFILNSNEESLLRYSSQSLKTIGQKAIKYKTSGLDIQVELSKILEIFNKTRKPQAIWQYIASITQVNDPQLIDCLKLYISSVTNGTFQEERYNLNANPHLQQLGLDIVNRWKEEAVLNINEASPNFVPLIKTENLHLIDTDDPFHLLLCGTEIQNSCQTVYGEYKYNKALLGYLMNGQTRLLAVVNEKEIILSRAIIRVLWDGEKPVVFLEQVLGSKEYAPALKRLAIEKAKQMGLDLVTYLQPGLPSYGKPVQSLGGRAPFEYCDALLYENRDITEAVMSDSQFTIRQATLLRAF